MDVQRCPECGQRLKTNYCDICMRKVPFGGVKRGKGQDPWDSWDSSSAHRMERGHECVSFGENRKTTGAGSSAHRTEKDHKCISFHKEWTKTIAAPAKKTSSANSKNIKPILAIIVAVVGLIPSLFGIFEDVTNSEPVLQPETMPVYESVPAIESRELYNDGQIIVTADSADISYDEYSIYMTVCNESDEAINVVTDLLSVNGYMQQAIFYAAAAPGEAVQSSLQLYSWELEEAGITDIAEISFYLNIYREEDYADIARSELITLETDLADSYELPMAPNGWELYVSDDVLLRLVSFTDYTGECEIQLYMENLSENTVSISTPAIYLNGNLTSDFLWETLRSDTRSLMSVYLYGEAEPIEEITLELLIEYLDGYEIIESRTETITFAP